MRKAMIIAASLAVVAMPFAAEAAGSPVVVNTALVQSADQAPAPLVVKKRRLFIPFGIAGLAAIGTGTILALRNRNSPG